jgi:hypothetical protein
MFEPFIDWNASGPQRDYILANDYFAGSIDDLEQMGLLPILVTDNMPTKLAFRVGLALCQVP